MVLCSILWPGQLSSTTTLRVLVHELDVEEFDVSRIVKNSLPDELCALRRTNLDDAVKDYCDDEKLMKYSKSPGAHATPALDLLLTKLHNLTSPVYHGI